MQDRLYHEAILALARNEAHAGRLAAPSATATVSNPLCGDRVTIDLTFDGARITAVAHTVRGCALCRAAAAVIGEVLPGRDSAALESGCAAARALLAGDSTQPQTPWETLAHFWPVSAYKSRHECVLLPFHAAADALAKA